MFMQREASIKCDSVPNPIDMENDVYITSINGVAPPDDQHGWIFLIDGKQLDRAINKIDISKNTEIVWKLVKKVDASDAQH